MSELSTLVEVLRGGRQCDEDGTEIIMSRQACVEAADEIESLKAQLAEEKKLSEAISRDCNATALERNDLRSELAECRDKALEEAAQLAGGHFIYGHSVAGVHFADALVAKIRSLKGVKP